MSDIEKARRLFKEAGLAFPDVPEELSSALEERERWVFSSRELEKWTYNLPEFVEEAAAYNVDDYVVLAHSGHGVNSYAIQYYLVYRNLRLFLHLGWGGAYADNERAAEHIAECFSLADKLVTAVQQGLIPQGTVPTIVGSDFYGSYWHPDGEGSSDGEWDLVMPAEVLKEALETLTAC